VQQQEIDLRDPELEQAFLHRPLQVAVAQAVGPHLGGDEEPLAVEIGFMTHETMPAYMSITVMVMFLQASDFMFCQLLPIA
jgi:hypothetical protein